MEGEYEGREAFTRGKHGEKHGGKHSQEGIQ